MKQTTHFGRSGFTLIELLVVTVIIGVLTAILLPVVGSIRRKGNMAKEISAARQLTGLSQLGGDFGYFRAFMALEAA